MISLFIVLISSVATLIGWVWITVSAGRDSTLWGLGCFFFGPLCLAYPILTDRFQELVFPWILCAFGLAITFVLPALGMPF